MADEMEPDFSQSNAEMRELRALSDLYLFDLHEFLRLLSEAGAPTLSAYVDDKATDAAGRTIVRYQLSEGLRTVLLALRARHLDANKVEGRAGDRRSFPRAVLSHQQTPSSIGEGR